MNKTVKLYDDTVTILFAAQARNRYLVQETGTSPVGVTTVLGLLNKPALMTWPMYEAIAHLKINIGDFEGAAKAYLTKSDTGKTTGTAVHAAIEQYLNGETPLPDPLTQKPLTAFVKWFEGKKKLATEQIVYSKQYDFCGTYDCLLEIDGKVVLCDIKTSNSSRTAPLGIYSENFLQLGAYSLAHHEENPLERIDELMIIRVGKDGVLNTLKASDVGLQVPDCEQGFVHVLEAYKLLTPLAKTLAERKS